VTWYSITISEEEAVQGKAEALVRDIYDIFRRTAADPSIAVLSTSTVGSHVDVFFSPAAAEQAGSVIAAYRGRKSAVPPAGAQLLLGSRRAAGEPDTDARGLSPQDGSPPP